MVGTGFRHEGYAIAEDSNILYISWSSVPDPPMARQTSSDVWCWIKKYFGFRSCWAFWPTCGTTVAQAKWFTGNLSEDLWSCWSRDMYRTNAIPKWKRQKRVSNNIRKWTPILDKKGVKWPERHFMCRQISVWHDKLCNAVQSKVLLANSSIQTNKGSTWLKLALLDFNDCSAWQGLIRRWDSERELLRSAPGSYPNSPK